jgi:hypothetical protein
MEPQALSDEIRTKGKRTSSRCPGAERRDIDTSPRLGEPVRISQQHPRICEEVVGERDRLSLLKVCVGRHDQVAGCFGLVNEDPDEVLDLLDPVIDSAPQVEAKIESDLIVAGTPGMETARIVTDQLAKTAFDRGVNVLVGVSKLELSGVRFFENTCQPVLDPGHGIGVEQADFAQHGHVGE